MQAALSTSNAGNVRKNVAEAQPHNNTYTVMSVCD